jgi:hypothetical protein
MSMQQLLRVARNIVTAACLSRADMSRLSSTWRMPHADSSVAISSRCCQNWLNTMILTAGLAPAAADAAEPAGGA